MSLKVGRKVKAVGSGGYIRYPITIKATGDVTVRFDDFDAYDEYFSERHRKGAKTHRDEIDDEVTLHAGEQRCWCRDARR